MSEVSCRAFTFFANAERAGVCRVDDLLAGLPFTRDQLSRLDERVAWNDWAVLTDRFAAAVGTEAALIDSCRFAIDERFAGALTRIAGMFAAPPLLYRVAMLWVASGLYRAVQFEVSELDDQRLRVTATLRPGYRESRAWFLLFAHGALLAPTFLDQPPATAESMRVDSRSAEVVIRTSRRRPSIWSRLQWRVRAGEVVARELVTQQEGLTAAFEDMRRATSSFKSVIDALPLAIAVMRDGKIRYANPALARLVGTNVASLQGCSLQQFVATCDTELAAALERGDGSGGRLHLAGTGADAVVLDARTVSASFEGEPAVIVIGLDVSEEVRARARLERSEATIRMLISTHPELVARLDQSLRVLDVQPGQFTATPSAFLSMVGRDLRELIAQAPSVLAPELLGALHGYEARMAAGQVFEHTLRITAPDGRTREFQLRGTPVTGGSESILVVRDDTARRDLDRRLALSEHLASIGVLTAGVAHEINNPLTYVALAVDSLVSELAAAAPENGHLADLVAAIRDGTDRIRSTVDRMKGLSRAASGTRAPVAPRRVVEGALAVVAHETAQRARVVAELQDTRDVMADDTQLGQVFINLLVNAAQALDGRAAPAGGHTIRVRLFEEGDAVIFECEDSGAGIAPERLGRVFDPFYTTKERGQGTGLGLAIVHQVVKDLGGAIEIRSILGQGTTFRVTLPVALSGATPDRDPGSTAPGAAAARRVRIYVIDDEPMIGRLVQRALHEHDVVLYTSAEPALAQLTAGDTPDLLICDVEMPGLSGIDLYERVAALRPELLPRFVFLTGGAFRERSSAFVKRPDVRVVQKPLSMASLRQLVLDATRRPE